MQARREMVLQAGLRRERAADYEFQELGAHLRLLRLARKGQAARLPPAGQGARVPHHALRPAHGEHHRGEGAGLGMLRRQLDEGAPRLQMGDDGRRDAVRVQELQDARRREDRHGVFSVRGRGGRHPHRILVLLRRQENRLQEILRRKRNQDARPCRRAFKKGNIHERRGRLRHREDGKAEIQNHGRLQPIGGRTRERGLHHRD